MIRAFPCLASAALALCLIACASSSDYPSLARRPAERITGTADVVAPAPSPSPAPEPPSTEMAARLSQLVEQARSAHQRFLAKRGQAERLVGAGAAVGSESWSVANVALADLEASRSQAVVALGELDEIYAAESVRAEEGGSAGNAGNADAAKAAHEQVNAWIDDEDDVLQRLRGRI